MDGGSRMPHRFHGRMGHHIVECGVDHHAAASGLKKKPIFNYHESGTQTLKLSVG